MPRSLLVTPAAPYTRNLRLDLVDDTVAARPRKPM
jgi:hypothetical protein